MGSLLFVGVGLSISLILIDPTWSPHFSLLLVAVALAAAFGGFGPGVLATCVAVVAAFFVLIPPRLTMNVTRPEDFVRLAMFVPSALFISWLVGAFIATEAKLQTSEERFRRLATSAPVGIFQTDAQGTLIYVNPAWCVISGIQESEAEGARWANAIHPEDRDRIRKLWRDAAERHEECGAEYRYRKPNGDVRWIRGMANPIRIKGKFAGYVGTITDITDSIAAQQTLIDREAWFREVCDYMPQMVWTSRPDGFTDYYNRTWYETTGAPPGSFGDESWQTMLHPDDLILTRERWSEAISSGRPFECENRWRNLKESGYRWYLQRAVPIVDTNGRIRKWVGTCTDIEDRKRADARLLRNEKLASAGKLAATIAHELNNPLGAVLNLVFLSRSADTLQAKNEFLSRAERELSRVSHVANRCLSMYAGGTAKTEVNLTALIDDAVGIFEATVMARQIKFEREIRDVPYLFGSPDELRQVLINLISNAVDAVPKNGMVRVRVSTNKHPKTGLQSVQILVTDNGEGIPDTAKVHVFDPFFTTKQQTGAGLGLWMTQNIVKAHGGTIHLRSSQAPDRHGTIVSVRLPVAVPSKAAA